MRVLSSLAVSPTLQSLERETGLQRQFLHQTLTRLRADGLVEAASLQLSSTGQQALHTGRYAHRTAERRAFYFRADAGVPAAFLPLSGLVGEVCQPEAEWHFDIAALDACLRRSQPWKAQHCFPIDIAPAETSASDWRHIAIDTPIRWPAALVRIAPDQLRAFAWSSRDNTLALTPLFTLNAEVACESFPELAAPTEADLNAAWQAWCLAHGCERVDAAADRVEGELLHVRGNVPQPLRRLATSDDAWLLIGSGGVRRAARIRVGK
jgi:hypothetical protein